jgi:hypothetical protein
MVFRVIKSDEVVANAERYRAIFAEGMHEAIGSAATATIFAALHMTLWGIVKRRERT